MKKTIRFIRQKMYKNAKILGDVDALLSGKLVKRIIRKKVGKMTNKVFRILK